MKNIKQLFLITGITLLACIGITTQTQAMKAQVIKAQTEQLKAIYQTAYNFALQGTKNHFPDDVREELARYAAYNALVKALAKTIEPNFPGKILEETRIEAAQAGAKNHLKMWGISNR